MNKKDRTQALRGLTSEQAGTLLNTWLTCDEQDKSTEYMLQLMQDTAGVDLDTVHAFIYESPDGVLSRAVYWGDVFKEPVPPIVRFLASKDEDYPMGKSLMDHTVDAIHKVVEDWRKRAKDLDEDMDEKLTDLMENLQAIVEP